ncbi:hypothetical protein MKX42_10955 [Paenibacillus sp. FSL R7-0204]|uniref:hypothetical protein n=1 Tax=Paenibacillus sp. FSL R7-0204 TaxID=2921675 RepID=UPI0030FA7B2F
MRYFQNRVFGMEGLCNQLMALYRTISEAFMCVQQGEEACIILADGQTRNFIDLSDEDFFSPLPIEAFIEVDQFHRALAAKGVSLLRPWDVVASHEPINECSRFPISPMSPDDSRNIGIWIAESIPFAQKPLLLAQSILGWMSQHPCWAALQMRLESDVMYNQNFQYDEYVREQDRLATDSIAQFPEVSAVYVATGVNEEFLLEAMPEFRERHSQAIILTKRNFLRLSPEMLAEFESLSLEEQALVDWLVCLGAPYFAGPHTSSFAYLAGYMRHYRGFEPDSTSLWPIYMLYWDMWFPKV